MKAKHPARENSTAPSELKEATVAYVVPADPSSMVRLEAVDGLDAAIADMGSAMAEALQAIDALPKGPP